MKTKRGNRANNIGEAEMPNEDKFYEEVTVTDKAGFLLSEPRFSRFLGLLDNLS